MVLPPIFNQIWTTSCFSATCCKIWFSPPPPELDTCSILIQDLHHKDWTPNVGTQLQKERIVTSIGRKKIRRPVGLSLNVYRQLTLKDEWTLHPFFHTVVPPSSRNDQSAPPLIYVAHWDCAGWTSQSAKTKRLQNTRPLSIHTSNSKKFQSVKVPFIWPKCPTFLRCSLVVIYHPPLDQKIPLALYLNIKQTNRFPRNQSSCHLDHLKNITCSAVSTKNTPITLECKQTT